MENPNTPPGFAPETPTYGHPHPKKPMLPGSLAALILGIVSLAGMAFFGWIPAIIGLNKAKEAEEANQMEPGKYCDNSIRMAAAGRKMSMIGLILGLLGILLWVLYFAFIFWVIKESNGHSGYEYY